MFLDCFFWNESSGIGRIQGMRNLGVPKSLSCFLYKVFARSLFAFLGTPSHAVHQLSECNSCMSTPPR